MQNISDAKRDAAECRRMAAAATATNPQAAWQLLVIAEAWDKVIRAYEREHRPDPRVAPLSWYLDMRDFVFVTVVALGALSAFDVYKYDGRHSADIWRQTIDEGWYFSHEAQRLLNR
jgi:hypothetical protein